LSVAQGRIRAAAPDPSGQEILMTVPPAAVLRSFAACCAFVVLAGCATTGERHPADPWEPGNRKAFAFNQAVDRAALRPVAKGYVAVVPKWMRTSVTNFFYNLDLPITIANQLLQGKPRQAGQDTLRFALNTTLGIGGLFDPASDAGLPRHNEDLGQTLGRWGVPPGPYLMVPLLGPSHVRDLPSHVFNRFLQPFYWYNYGNERWISLGLSIVDQRARLLPLDETLARAYDPYAFVRDAFIQRRLYQVWDGNIPERYLPPEDEPADGEEPWPENEPDESDESDGTDDAPGDTPAPPQGQPD
jgi:phospholipid-binding lipoprotein MlaA